MGWTLKNSAIAVGLNYQYVKQIVKKYNEIGAEGVKNHRRRPSNHRRGKTPLLNDQQLQKLIKELRLIPADGGIWTGPKVARWIEKEILVERVANLIGWDYLKKCNYSWLIPRPKHRKAEEKAQQEFKQKLPLKVKELQQKYPLAQKRSIVF